MIMKTQKRTFFRQLLLASTLALGFATLWLLAAFIAGSIVARAFAGPATGPLESRVLTVQSDGTLLIKTTPRDNSLKPSYRDSSGASVPPPETEAVEGHYLTGRSLTRGFWQLDVDWLTRLKTFDDPQNTDVVWYFIHDGAQSGAGYFAGYRRSTSALLGFIAEAGSRSDRPPPDEQIPVKSALLTAAPHWVCRQSVYNDVSRPAADPHNLPIRQGWVYVPSGNRLRLVDLSARTVRTAFDAGEPIESFEFCTQNAGMSANSSRQPWLVVRNSREPWLLLRTLHTIVVLNGDHEVMRTFAIPEKWHSAEIVWYFLRDSRALVQFDQWWREGENVLPQTFCRVGPDGVIERETALPSRSGMPVWRKQQTALLLACAVPAPLVVSIADLFVELLMNQPGNFAAAVRSLLEGWWPSLLAVIGLALLLAVAAWRRARAFGLPARERACWAIFVFLLGIPGYAGYRLARRWPPRVECPHCHVPAPRDRRECARCHSPFPAPAPRGIEVFA
jgi:hypothetical protein